MSVPEFDIAAIVEAAAKRGGAVTPQDFPAAGEVGGTKFSAFLAYPGDRGAGVLVLGYETGLAEPQDMGLEIAVADEGATIASTGAVEESAIDAINLLPGYRAERVGEGLRIETAAGITFDPDAAAGAVVAWLTRQHALSQFAVRFIFGPPGGRSVVLRDLRQRAYDAHSERKAHN